MDDDLKALYKRSGDFPAVSKSEIDTKGYAKAEPSEFLKRRKMLGSPSTKDIALALVRSSPIGRAARAIKGVAKATGLMGAGYAANEAEDVIREKIEKKKHGGSVFIPRGQKAIQVKKQVSRER